MLHGVPQDHGSMKLLQLPREQSYLALPAARRTGEPAAICEGEPTENVELLPISPRQS